MRKSSESGKSVEDSAISFKPKRKSPKATTTMFFGGNRSKPKREDSTSLMSRSNLSKMSKQTKKSKKDYLLEHSRHTSRHSNDSFVSPYNRETRLDRIMKLKVAPQIKPS